MNPKKERSHEEYQLSICVCCGTKSSKCVRVTKVLEDAVQKFVFPGYFASNDSYPKGACQTCRRYLFLAKKNGKTAIPLNVRSSWNIDYARLRPPSRKSPCNCSSCQVGRFKGENLESGSSADLPRKAAESIEEADAPESSETCDTPQTPENPESPKTPEVA